ncbi:hypothetical protein [Cupriavidus necator]
MPDIANHYRDCVHSRTAGRQLTSWLAPPPLIFSITAGLKPPLLQFSYGRFPDEVPLGKFVPADHFLGTQNSRRLDIGCNETDDKNIAATLAQQGLQPDFDGQRGYLFVRIFFVANNFALFRRLRYRYLKRFIP